MDTVSGEMEILIKNQKRRTILDKQPHNRSKNAFDGLFSGLNVAESLS